MLLTKMSKIQNAEAIKQLWSGSDFIAGYVGIFLKAVLTVQ